MKEYQDLTGKRFGRLIVLQRAQNLVSKSGRNYIRWMCQCNCGNICTVLGDNLKYGRTLSCGCYKKEHLSSLKSTHGQTDSRLYGVWQSMKARCYNAHSTHYDRYGGRGISLCDEWKNSFQTFSDWATQNGYRDGLSIERIDNDGDYTPDNCRWATMKEQANNRESNVRIAYRGEEHTATEWAAIVHISAKTLFSRIYAGWSVERVLSK